MCIDMDLRLARLDEKEVIVGLQWRASLNNEGDREVLLAHPGAIDVPVEQIAEGRVIVAERVNEIVGFAVVLLREDGDAELDGLFVEPRLWRSGIGRRLVEFASQLALNDGSKRLHVIGNHHARDFYLALGFELHGEAKTQFGTGMMLSKSLDYIIR